MKHSLLKKVFIVGACLLLSGSLLVGCGNTKQDQGAPQAKGSQSAPPNGKKPSGMPPKGKTPPKGKKPTGTPPKGAPQGNKSSSGSTGSSSSSSN